jgi:hypothetical protein
MDKAGKMLMMQKMLKKKKKRDERVLRNLDDEVFRIAPKERMGGAEGRDARSERRRINREKDVEKGMLNRLSADRALVLPGETGRTPVKAKKNRLKAAAKKRADLRKKTKENMRKRRQSQKAIY